MASTMNLMVVGSFLVLICLTGLHVDALQCYFCARGSACAADPFNVSAAIIMNCSDAGSCIKTVYDDGTATRLCLDLGFKEGCDDDDDNWDVSCACSDNLCNAGTSIVTSVPFTPVLVTVLALVWNQLRGL